MITAKLYKDSRTGEIIDKFLISDIQFMEEVITTNGDTRKEVQEKRQQIYDIASTNNCELSDIEDIVGDGDIIDYI